MAAAPEVCVGALVFDPQGRLFLQRRSPTRRLFPNCWDTVGGHVEPGETVEQALVREVWEETGWRVERIHPGPARIAWTGDDGRHRVEYDFPVTVSGDLTAPQLEAGRHTDWHWATESELALLTEHRTVDDGLLGWLAQLAAAFPGRQPPAADPLLVADAATVGAAVDRAFVAAMRRLPQLAGGAELVRAHGGPRAVGALIEFRTALGRPGRWVTGPEALAVARYRDAGQLLDQLRAHAAAGTLELAPAGAFRATAAGHDFLRSLRSHLAQGLRQCWDGQPVDRAGALLAPLLAAAPDTAGPAWHAMAPVYEPPGTPAELLLLDRLGTLRYHRADAHAAAWRAAGRTAAEMVALPSGPERSLIEDRTNSLAAPPYRSLTPAERAELRDNLAALPG